MHTNTEDKITTEYGSELRSITKNAGFGALGMFFMTAMAFVSNIVITRNLGVELYGIFVLVTNVFNFVVLISQLGFENAIIRFVPFYLGKEKDDKVKGTILFGFRVLLLLSIMVLILSQLIAPFIAERIFNRPEIIPLLRILLFSIPFSILAIVSYASLNGLKLIKFQVIAANILNPIIFFILVVICFWLGYSLVGLIWVMLIMGPINLALAYYFLNKKYFKTKRNIKPKVEKKEVFQFAIPLYFNQFLNNAIKFIPIFIMGVFLTNKDIGIFNVAFKIAMIVSISLGAFKLIFAPTISSLFAKNNKQLINQLYKTITKWMLTIASVILVIIILFAETILSIFGAEFLTGINILLILMIGELINVAVGLVGNIIIMSGRPKIALYNSGITFIMITILCYLLIPEYGIIGAALAYTITVGITNVIRLIELYSFERMHPFKISFYKPIVVGILVYIVVFYAKTISNLDSGIELVLGSLLSVLLFVSLLCLFKLDEEDKYILRSIARKFNRNNEG